MPSIIIKNRMGQPITDWQGWTPPKQSDHWKAGRSAMELAKSWLLSATPQCPPELIALFKTNSLTASLQLAEGHPEFVTPLPERGEGRNHDMMLRGTTVGGKTVVCVEAKVDESFGLKVGDYWHKAKGSIRPTRAPQRIQSLLEIVFGANSLPDQLPWCDLRYQLLTGIAGTLLQAVHERAPVSVFFVHEFQTSLASPKRLNANAQDYQRFVELLFSVSSVTTGQIYGPLNFRPRQHLTQPVNLYVGKAVGSGSPA